MKTIPMIAAATLVCTLAMAQPPQGSGRQTPPQGRSMNGQHRPGEVLQASAIVIPAPEQRAKLMAANLQRELNLSPEQVKKVEKIYLKAYTKEDKANQARKAALKNVLTSDQYKKLESDGGTAVMRRIPEPGRPPRER